MKATTPQSYPDFHIGQLVKAELVRQGRTATWLAKQVHCTPENIYKAYRQQWISMPLLFEISKALDYDFFRFYINRSEGEDDYVYIMIRVNKNDLIDGNICKSCKYFDLKK